MKSQVQASEIFFADLKKSIALAKKRILIQVMLFDLSSAMEEYILLLVQAAQRGVDVRVTVDWISERYYGDNLDVYPPLTLEKIQFRKKMHQRAEQVYARLQAAGVKVHIVLTPPPLGKVFLLGKRNHNKIIIIDDVLWMGGCNIIANAHKYRDFMVKIHDTAIISIVSQHLFNGVSYDIMVTCTPEYTLLVDAGKKGSSLIYDKAIALIKKAKKRILFVSQMLPDSHFLDGLLQKSQEGVDVLAVISNAQHNIFTKFPFRYHYSLFQNKIKNNKHFTLIHSREWIHAKLLVVDDQAIFGSHNFAKWNELTGIEETDLLTTDRKLITQLEMFVKGLHNISV